MHSIQAISTTGSRRTQATLVVKATMVVKGRSPFPGAPVLVANATGAKTITTNQGMYPYGDPASPINPHGSLLKTNPGPLTASSYALIEPAMEQEVQMILNKIGFHKINPPVLHGGRMKHYLANWKVLTQDPWILDIVTERPIDWLETPTQTREPRELTFDKETSDLVDLEVQSMISIGVIEPCTDCPGQFVSTLFLRPK